MPQPNKIPLAFAASGDKNTIPENTETTGLASWRDGFPAITSVPFSEGGIAPKRADFNGIFNALSQAVMWMQQGGVYVYDTNTDYEAGNVILDAGGLYVANSANGPSSSVVQPSSDSTGATWKPVRLDLATQSAAGYMSAADKSAVDSIQGLGTFNAMYFSQTSGTFTPTRTGVYRITIKGGGGGGAGANTSSYINGGQGGEAGALVFYKILTQNISYPYVIGAGGAAGTNGSSPTSGSDGGNTSFNSEYIAPGGGGANIGALRGGGGGESFTVPSGETVFRQYGDDGLFGAQSSSSSAWTIGQPGFTTARYGRGGKGGGGPGSSKNPAKGGDGFILIEYQG